MSMGLGHRYWVRMIKHKVGTLEECIDFMKKNKPNSKSMWFELRPLPNLKLGICEEYAVDLVELAK